MKCIACDKEATKVMTMLIATEPDEQEGYMSYKIIPDIISSYFCDKHSFVFESHEIEK